MILEIFSKRKYFPRTLKFIVYFHESIYDFLILKLNKINSDKNKVLEFKITKCKNCEKCDNCIKEKDENIQNEKFSRKLNNIVFIYFFLLIFICNLSIWFKIAFN